MDRDTTFQFCETCHKTQCDDCVRSDFCETCHKTQCHDCALSDGMGCCIACRVFKCGFCEMCGSYCIQCGNVTCRDCDCGCTK